MDVNQYVEDRIIEFLDEFHIFLKVQLSAAFDDWFEEGVARHVGPAYIEKTKAMLNHPLRTVEMGKEDEELYGVEHIQNIIRGNKNLFDAKFENVERVCVYLGEIAEMRHNVSHRRRHHLPTMSSVRHCLDTASILLRAIGSERHVDFARWADAVADGSNPWGQGLASSLPPRENVVSKFVGRPREMEELYAWFDSPDTNRWVVWGDGGAGKSAVAYEFAARLRDANPSGYVQVGWISAKAERFAEGRSEFIAPDFTDTESAVQALLQSLFPWEIENASDETEATAAVIRGLAEMPSFVVIDDIDTLIDDAPLLEFLTFRLPQQASKILFTSRTKLPGLNGTEVRGFEGEELLNFLATRAAMFDIPTDAVQARSQEIFRVTRGYPLYVEDLLRLSVIQGIDRSLEDWGQRKGDAARSYALQRQVARLAEGAKATLIAVCLSRSPLSLIELCNVLGRSEEETLDALQDLRRAFLISPPRDADSTPRFECNANTRRLVEATFGKEDIFASTKGGLRSLAGELKGLAAKRSIGTFVRQATIHAQQREWEAAERALTDGLERVGEDGSLYSALGWLYKTCVPRRVADSRSAFRRAHQLQAPRRDTYWHWVGLETDLGDWAGAADAAECGLERLPGDRELLFLAGHARSRLGQDLAKQFQYDRADAELRKAEVHLIASIAAATTSEKQIPPGRIFRAIVLTYEALEEWQKLVTYLRKWEREAPDSNLDSERDRLAYRHPEVHKLLMAV